jgi:hypothetical protein
MVQSWQTAWLSTIYDKRTLGFPSGKCCTYFSFLFCHICACTFVTGVKIAGSNFVLQKKIKNRKNKNIGLNSYSG